MTNLTNKLFKLIFVTLILYSILNTFFNLSMYLGENIFVAYALNLGNIMSTNPSSPIPWPSPSPTPYNTPTSTPVNSPVNSPKPAPKPKPKSAKENGTVTQFSALAMKLFNNFVKVSHRLFIKAIAAVAVLTLGGVSIIVPNLTWKIINFINNSQFFIDIDWYGNLTYLFNLTSHLALDYFGIAMLVY
jgi:hypothetical protein